MSILIKLKEMKKGASKIEDKIIEYILRNLQEMRLTNTYELAEKSGVSQASIVRFSKKMGYSGFPEFKISLVEDLKSQGGSDKITLVDEGIRIDDAAIEVAHKIFQINIGSLENTLKVLEIDAIEESVNLIMSSKRVLILGSGSSAIIAKYFQSKLLEIGIDASFEFDQHIQALNISRIGKEDVAFIISQSGRTLDTYTMEKKLRGKGIKVISLTNMAPNPIKEISDVSLWTASDSCAITSTFTHRIAQLSVLDLIYVNIILRNKELAERYLGEAFHLTEDMKLS